MTGPKELAKNDEYDHQAVAVMELLLRPDSNCLDVGCNWGSFLAEMVRLAPGGAHMAFEPLPHLHEKLVAKYPDVDVRRVALSNVAGTSTFQFVTNFEGYSGLRRRMYPGEPEIEEIEVETARLDDLLAGDRRVDFIKIDVEGAERLVLEGAVATLRHWRPTIVFEFGRGASEYYGTTPDAMFDLLAGEGGLAIYVMQDWLAGKPALTREDLITQFDRGLNFYFMATRNDNPRPA